jgi:cytochrome c oxidase assembly protein subunit 15
MRLAAPPQGRAVVSGRNKLILIARIGLIILLIQVTLGGWMSSNYAANGCIEFPTCHSGLWWPTMNFREAFVIWRGIEINYEFGILSGAARTAIHMAHRTGALITCLYLGWLSFHLFRHAHSERIVSLNILLLTGLSLQVGLGITNVLAQLPLSIAVAHNGMAALLVLVLLTIVRRLKRANAFD